MALTYKASSLYMEWCLECHRQPENYLRPKESVFTMGWQPEGDQQTEGRKLVEAYHVNVAQLTNCYVCHR